MTQQEILDYNKNCLEFLGYKCVTPDDKDFRIYEGENKSLPNAVEANFNDDFLNNWNWIMEVVDAIEKKVAWVNIIGCKVDISSIFNGNAKTKKEAVVKAINQTLIWYNHANTDK